MVASHETHTHTARFGLASPERSVSSTRSFRRRETLQQTLEASGCRPLHAGAPGATRRPVTWRSRMYAYVSRPATYSQGCWGRSPLTLQPPPTGAVSALEFRSQIARHPRRRKCYKCRVWIPLPLSRAFGYGGGSILAEHGPLHTSHYPSWH